jgi:cytidylate kinase
LADAGAGEAASQVAAHPGVRAALLQAAAGLRRPAGRCGAGRARHRHGDRALAAPAKIFVTASPRVRAERRWRQLVLQDAALTLDEVLEDIRRRDERDSSRASAPLVKAEDAVLLDTSEMDIAAAVEAARRIVDDARARWLESSAPGRG